MSQKSQPKEGESNSVSFSRALEKFLTRFPDRSRDILVARFGIADGRRRTLEEIGKTYGITRERVRQVIDTSLRHLKRLLAEQTEVAPVLAIREVLERASLLIPTAHALDILAKDNVKERGALTVFLHALPGTKILKETKERHECIVDLTFSLSEWGKLMTALEEKFQAEKEVMSIEELTAAIAPRFEKLSLTPEKLGYFLAPSLLIDKNVFGRYGLVTWSAIRPRGTRERAYLILKMLGEPQHFRDIARLIDEYGLYREGKKTHPQTVHNELIKDKRFVLVGRGTYALAEWGYKRGTVRDVLSDILKTGAKPMTREEILSAIMKVRRVKKSTVIINLNTFFTKVGKNIYTVGKS